jgi:acyl-CoA reductase-like NAD-dependent aldehyde dehydrogenase
MSERIEIKKTFKLLINGGFPRSESGRSYEVRRADGEFWANAARASRKDLRDAVVAARAAQGKWWGATAYNRGQILYRWAEMAEERRDELVEHVRASEGVDVAEAHRTVSAAIDRIVWYAGWTDKITQVLGGANPVAGPYFNFSLPTPSGVVVVFAPPLDSLRGFVECVLAPLAVGNTVVAVTSTDRPTPAMVLAEMTETSDFPAGVLNVLSGDVDELATPAATHGDVDGLDLTGVVEGADELARLAASTIKRVYRPRVSEGDSLRRLRTFIETSTVWHTIGQ